MWRERQRDRERQRQTDRQTDRQRKRNRQTDRQKAGAGFLFLSWLLIVSAKRKVHLRDGGEREGNTSKLTEGLSGGLWRPPADYYYPRRGERPQRTGGNCLEVTDRCALTLHAACARANLPHCMLNKPCITGTSGGKVCRDTAYC